MKKEDYNNSINSGEFFMWTVDDTAEDDEWTISLKAKGICINFKLDIDVQAEVLWEIVILALGEKPQVVEGKWVNLRGYRDELIPMTGACQ